MKKACSVILAVLFLITSTRAVLAQVMINEFLPNPLDESQEWVEFFNSGPSVEDLSTYFFDDDIDFSGESGSTKILLSGLLSPQSTCYLSLSRYLNNSGDSPTLFSSDGNTKDTYTYSSSVEEKSFARVPDGGPWEIEQIPTKSSTSCVSLAPTPSPTPSPTPTPTKTPTPAPTPTKTPTPTPTKTPTPKPTKTPLPKPTDSPTENSVQTPTPTPEATVLGESTEKKGSVLPYLLIVGGIACLGFAGYSLYNRRSEIS